MKNTKPFWKVIYVLLIIGVITIIAGTILGGFKNASLNINEYNINTFEKIANHFFDKNDYVDVDFNENEMIYTDDIDAEIGYDVKKIDLVTGGGNAEIIESDGTNIKIKTNNVEEAQYYVVNNTLYIKAVFSGNVSEYDKIEIYIPSDMMFSQIDVTMGAGTFTVEKLMADKANFVIGAGKFSLQDAEVNDLTVELGMGEFSYEGIINNKADIDCFMGSVLMKLANNQNEYSYTLGCFMGNVKYGSSTISGVGTKESDNISDKDFDIECGMGDVDITFLSDK